MTIATIAPVRTASIPESLTRLDRVLDELDRAMALVLAAERTRAVDPRGAFELAHRGALRAAGVVIEHANRGRTRRLPLNAWTAISRCGARHRAWAQGMEPMVAERARLDRDPSAQPDPVLLDEHCRSTRERIEALRIEMAMALLPGEQLVPAVASARS